MIAVRRLLEPTARAHPDIVRFHGLAHPLLAYRQAFGAQLANHARPAVSLFAGGELGADMSQQRQIADPAAELGRPRFGSPPTPCAKAAGAHLQHPALDDNRPHVAMRLDEGVSHLDPLAKYAVAFFKMSRSIRTRARSAFKRLISICSWLTAFTPSRSLSRPPPPP